MKVLFLDIDGVINTMAECGYRRCFGEGVAKLTERRMLSSKVYPFDPTSMYYLHNIIKETGCKIVVSSTWRTDLEEMKSWFADGIIKDAIIDRTPYSKELPQEYIDTIRSYRGSIQRGDEIKHYLNTHPEINKYAILDDDSDMDVVRRNFFQTDTYDGLDRKVSQAVIHHLNKEELIKNQYRMNIALTKFKSELDSSMDDIPKNLRDELIQTISKTINGWSSKE